MKNKKEHMGLIWLIPALIFFCNPNLHLLDFLPDFIGYIFLCKALSKLAELNEGIEKAVGLFRKMIWVDLGKWLVLFFTFSMSAAGEQESSLLLWTFVASVVELIVLIPAYTKLFYGITKLGYFYPNTAIFAKVKNRRSATDRAKKRTITHSKHRNMRYNITINYFLKRRGDFMNIKEYRVKMGYTQEQIAKLLNIKQNTYSNKENGKRAFTIDEIRKLKRILNTTYDELLN